MGFLSVPKPGETAVLSHPLPSHPWEVRGSQGTYLLLLQADKCQDFKANSSAEISAVPRLPGLDSEQLLLLWQLSGVFLFFWKEWA